MAGEGGRVPSLCGWGLSRFPQIQWMAPHQTRIGDTNGFQEVIKRKGRKTWRSKGKVGRPRGVGRKLGGGIYLVCTYKIVKEL